MVESHHAGQDLFARREKSGVLQMLAGKAELLPILPSKETGFACVP